MRGCGGLPLAASSVCSCSWQQKIAQNTIVIYLPSYFSPRFVVNFSSFVKKNFKKAVSWVGMNPRVNRNNSRRTEWAHFHSHVSIKIKLGTTESRVSPVLNFPHLIIRSFAWTEKCCLWVFLFLTSQRFKGGGAIQFNSAVSRVVLLSRTLCKICQIATVHSSDLRLLQ